MLDLRYSLVIEATADPLFFSFHSPTLEGFTGVGSPVEDCLYEARFGMDEHVALLRERKLTIPEPETEPTVLVRNSGRSAAA
jgi:predicted RNase H-like HicB family nuclease